MDRIHLHPSITPGDYFGYKQSGELETRSFPSRAKMTQESCRILAVVGSNDFRNNAAPDVDGWFFSDFYLLKHFLQPLSNTQTWLTCVDPKALVQKYGPYMHGNPHGLKRRVVLDSDIAENMQNLSVCQADDLLQWFCKAMKEQSAAAKVNDQTLIIVLLGHGEPKSYRIAIGGAGDQTRGVPRTNRFDLSLAARCLAKDTKTLFINSACYSGGWTISPLFNSCMMSATNFEDESISWPVADGRAGGSVFVTAIVEALIEQGIEDLEIDDEGYPITAPCEQTATYAGLVKAVSETYANREGAFGRVDLEEALPTFSAQDDAWDKVISDTGLSAQNLVDRMALLTLAENPRRTSTIILSGSAPPMDPVLRVTETAARRIMCSWARKYLKSEPGIPNSAKNLAVVYAAQQLLDLDTELSAEKLIRTGKWISYRLELMEQATLIARRLGSGHVCNNWASERYKARHDPQYQAHLAMVRRLRMFEDPMPDEGLADDKPNRFVGMVCYEKYELEEAKARLLIIKKKMPPGKLLTTIGHLLRHTNIRDSLRAVATEAGKRLSSELYF